MEPYYLTEKDFSDISRMFKYGIVTSIDGAVRRYQQKSYNKEAKKDVNIWQQLLRIRENKAIDE
jgi:hypothetical protein